jgi:DNA-binding transcriptional MerR regulator
LPKATDAFRNIGEVSSELGVRKHVLRFWESKFPQLKPMKRGGGRRYYRPADMQLLCGIRHLLQTAGYTIKGVQKILREQGADEVKRLAAAPVAKPATGRMLSAAEVKALREVASVLGDVQTLLAGVLKQGAPASDRKRAARQ